MASHSLLSYMTMTGQGPTMLKGFLCTAEAHCYNAIMQTKQGTKAPWSIIGSFYSEKIVFESSCWDFMC